MDKSSFEEIFRRYYEQKATAEEKAIFFESMQEPGHAEQLSKLIIDLGLKHKADNVNVIKPGKAKAIIDKVLLGTGEKKSPVLKMNWWKYVSVAAALVILIAGSYLFFQARSKKDTSRVNQLSSQPVEIKPGGNRAVLILADGKQIILDSVKAGSITDQAHVKIIKTDDGQISYVNDAGSTEILYNTISTPIGGQYQIVLADGSKVWLNAASSLRYPASFAGKDRTVELKGEGYFEITHDAAKPFKVAVDGTIVEVIGTRFNINAYNDEPKQKTTLLEGKVKIENGGTVRFLNPGQQVITEGPGKLSVLNNADLEEAVAWKNGKFIFNNVDIHSVMRQLSRWYDINVQYVGTMPDDVFIGVIPIPRSENISAILNILQRTQVISFKVNGRTITVTPYQN